MQKEIFYGAFCQLFKYISEIDGIYTFLKGEKEFFSWEG